MKLYQSATCNFKLYWILSTLIWNNRYVVVVSDFSITACKSFLIRRSKSSTFTHNHYFLVFSPLSLKSSRENQKTPPFMFFAYSFWRLHWLSRFSFFFTLICLIFLLTCFSLLFTKCSIKSNLLSSIFTLCTIFLGIFLCSDFRFYPVLLLLPLLCSHNQGF